MKLLLLKTVEKLGKIGSVVDVADGHARNRLLPMGLAVKANKENLRQVEELQKIAKQEELVRLADLKAAAEAINGAEVTIRQRATEQGHLYGSVSARDIAAAFAAEGKPVPSEMIRLEKPIQQLDKYKIDLDFGDDITAQVDVWIVPEVQPDEEEDEATEKPAETPPAEPDAEEPEKKEETEEGESASAETA